MKVISLFSGIGAFEKALTNIGVDYELVNFCEIDTFAPISYCSIHHEPIEKNLGDVTKIEIENLPYVDLITHGSPCQDFSIAGKQAGADGGKRSSLMWNTVEIVKHCKPKYVVWENVKNVLSAKHRHNFDKYVSVMQDIGYNSYFKVLNAKDYGIPQNRERIFIISIRKDIHQTFVFPKKQVLKLSLKDVLDDDVDEKYFLSDKLVSYFQKHKEIHKERGNRLTFLPYETTDGVIAKCLDTREGGRATNNFIKIAGNLNLKGRHESACRVYEIDGLAPAVNTFGGGGLETKIVVPTKPLKIAAEPGNHYGGGVFDDKAIAPTLTTSDKGGETNNIPKVLVLGNYHPSNHETSRVLDVNGIAPCVKENHGTIPAIHQVGGVYLNCSPRFEKGILNDLPRTIKASSHDAGVVVNERIRKLTPKECYRLMGFSDKDFDLAKWMTIEESEDFLKKYPNRKTKQNKKDGRVERTSDSQLYHQAGNSIVVKVLEEIFKNLFLNLTFGESPHEVGTQISLIKEE